jgi:hypothetical protein
MGRFAKGANTGTSATTDRALSVPILEILTHLKLSTAHLRMHPRDATPTPLAGAAVHQAVAAYLEHHPRLALAQTPQGLLVNGQRLAARDFATITLEASLISLLLDAGLRSITFRRGVSPEEVAPFLHAFAHRFWGLRDPREINRRLRELNVGNVQVDEPDAAAPQPSDRTPAAPPDPAEPRPTKSRTERTREGLRDLWDAFQKAPPAQREALRRVAAVLAEPFRHDFRAAPLLRGDLPPEAAALLPEWLGPEPARPASDILKAVGSLEEFAPDVVLEAVSAWNRTGLLTLNFSGRVARVYFEDGLVVAAEFEDRRDQDAFNAFLDLRRGEFLFQAGEPAPDRRLRCAARRMILEARRAAGRPSDRS